MKKRICVIALMLAMLLMLAGCSAEKALIGKWSINEVSAGDVTMTEEDIDDMGLDAGYIRLNKSGSAEINLLGDEYEGTWAYEKEGSATVTYGDDQQGKITVKDKVMTFVDAQGSTYKAERF